MGECMAYRVPGPEVTAILGGVGVSRIYKMSDLFLAHLSQG
jgi:hypothetical protein